MSFVNYVDNILIYLTESLSSFPEPYCAEPRTSHRDGPHQADKSGLPLSQADSPELETTTLPAPKNFGTQRHSAH